MKFFDFINLSNKEDEQYTYVLEVFQWKKKELEPGFFHNRRRCFFQIHCDYDGSFFGRKSLFRSHFSILEPTMSSFFNIGFGVNLFSIDFTFFCDSFDSWRDR